MIYAKIEEDMSNMLPFFICRLTDGGVFELAHFKKHETNFKNMKVIPPIVIFTKFNAFIEDLETELKKKFKSKG